jgi:hypothetical protein
MKKYTIFYKSYGSDLSQPVYVDCKGIYWLGGGRVDWILTSTKAEAEAIARKVRKQRTPTNYDDGKVFVEMAKLRPWGE